MVVSSNSLDAKLAILRTIHLSVVAHHHAGDILSSLNMRNIKRLDARRKARQFERFLQLFEHQFHVGLQNPEALLKSKFRIFLPEVDQIALLATLTILNLYAPPFARA